MNEQILYHRPLPGAKLNMAHPLTKGLVGMWLFNENGGMGAMDVSPYNNVGTALGFAKRPFNGLKFDGTANYIKMLAKSQYDNTRELSVEFWFQSPAGDDGYIVNKGWKAAELGTEHPWRFINVAGGTPRRIQFSVCDNAPLSTDLVSDTQLPANVIHHVVGVANAAAMTLYFNGGMEKTAAFTGNPLGINTADIYVGARNANGVAGTFAAMTLYKLAIYSRVLLPEEVRTLHEEPYRMFL